VSFAPRDRVHLPRVGTGVVLEVRDGGRVRIEIKGRTMVVDAAQLEPAGAGRKPPSAAASDGREDATPARTINAAASIDLHGLTVAEAVDALDTFLNDALLASLPEVRIVHGRSGGKIRDAVHRRLREIAAVRVFRVDPRNAGVTIVAL
jgi:dsDNA-specific endonuclease/ATPase MutS2